jgi:hypothetical protein
MLTSGSNFLEKLHQISVAPAMRYFWLIVNLYILLISPIGGYNEIMYEDLSGTNPDLVFGACGFFILIAFCPGAVAYAIHRHPDLTLRSPSLMRCPLAWWIDPIQSLFISAASTSLSACGSFAAYVRVGGNIQYWTTASTAFFAAGLWTGIALACVIYRRYFFPPDPHRAVLDKWPDVIRENNWRD